MLEKVKSNAKAGDASRGWLAPQLIIISRDNVGHHHDEDEEDNDDEDKVDDDSEDFIITNFINFINTINTTQSLCLPQNLRPRSSLFVIISFFGCLYIDISSLTSPFIFKLNFCSPFYQALSLIAYWVILLRFFGTFAVQTETHRLCVFNLTFLKISVRTQFS